MPPAFSLAWTTTLSRSRTSSSAPCGWIDPARWICSRSQFKRSASPKAGVEAARVGTCQPPRVRYSSEYELCPRMSVHLVLRQFLVKSLPAHAEDLSRRGAVAVGEIERGPDVMPLHQADGVADQAAQRGFAGLLDDRGERRLQAGGVLRRRHPAPDVAQQQRDLVRPGQRCRRRRRSPPRCRRRVRPGCWWRTAAPNHGGADWPAAPSGRRRGGTATGQAARRARRPRRRPARDRGRRGWRGG